MLYKSDVTSKDRIQNEVEGLHQILIDAERPEVFCSAHELVSRNRITSKKDKILKASNDAVLGAFLFLINKN